MLSTRYCAHHKPSLNPDHGKPQQEQHVELFSDWELEFKSQQKSFSRPTRACRTKATPTPPVFLKGPHVGLS